MNPCADYYPVQFSPCSSFGVELNVANTTYWIWIEDKFGNWYTKQVTTDDHGNFTIDPADYPEGLFAVGSFMLYVSTNKIRNTMEAFVIDGTSYSCFFLRQDAPVYGSFDGSFDKSFHI